MKKHRAGTEPCEVLFPRDTDSIDENNAKSIHIMSTKRLPPPREMVNRRPLVGEAAGMLCG